MTTPANPTPEPDGKPEDWSVLRYFIPPKPDLNKIVVDVTQLRKENADLTQQLSDTRRRLAEVEKERDEVRKIIHEALTYFHDSGNRSMVAGDTIPQMFNALTDEMDDAKDERDEAKRQLTSLRNAADGMLQALAFYADPDSYFAIMILPDHPAGEFADDFSEDHGGDYDRPMPGKLAREAIKAAGALISEGNQPSSDSNSPTASRESQG